MKTNIQYIKQIVTYMKCKLTRSTESTNIVTGGPVGFDRALLHS